MRETRVHVRLYGILRDRLPPEAGGETTLTLKGDASVADVAAWLRQMGVKMALEFAVNGEVVDGDRPLSDGDRVEIFSPVAGG